MVRKISSSEEDRHPITSLFNVVINDIGILQSRVQTIDKWS